MGFRLHASFSQIPQKTTEVQFSGDDDCLKVDRRTTDLSSKTNCRFCIVSSSHILQKQKDNTLLVFLSFFVFWLHQQQNASFPSQRQGTLARFVLILKMATEFGFCNVDISVGYPNASSGSRVLTICHFRQRKRTDLATTTLNEVARRKTRVVTQWRRKLFTTRFSKFKWVAVSKLSPATVRRGTDTSFRC